MKRLVLAAAFFLCPTAQAQVSVGMTVPLPVYVPPTAPSVVVQVAPPAPRLEPQPVAPLPGAVWIPGHWKGTRWGWKWKPGKWRHA